MRKPWRVCDHGYNDGVDKDADLSERLDSCQAYIHQGSYTIQVLVHKMLQLGIVGNHHHTHVCDASVDRRPRQGMEPGLCGKLTSNPCSCVALCLDGGMYLYT